MSADPAVGRTLVDVTREGRVARMTMRRPPQHKLDLLLTRALHATLAELDAADDVRAIVLTGSEGVLELVGDQKVTWRRADGTREQFDDVRSESEGDPHLVPMRRWAEQVRHAVRSGEAIVPSFADGLACRRVLDRLIAG